MSRALLMGLLLLGSSMAANAEIVTFDSVPAGFSPTPMTTYVENGVTVTSVDGNFWAYPDPGTLHFDPALDGFGNSAYDFTYAGGAFDLLSFDITFAEGFGLILEGYDEAGTLLNTLALDGFGTIEIDGFEGIYTLRMTNVGNHLSIDNVTISPPVPEPSTWVMMLLGFGAVGYGLRRLRTTAGTITSGA